MRKHFLALEESSRTWINVADRDGLREAQLLGLIDEYIPTEPLLGSVYIC